MASPTSNLNLAANLYAKGLSVREARMPMVYASDYGYNVIQQVLNLASKDGAKQVEDPKFEIPKLGNISVAENAGAAPSLVGTNLRVTLANANNNFRLKDVVMDSNFIQGRIVNIVSPTQFDIEPVSSAVTAWNPSTHFQSGSRVKVGFDASGNFGSKGKNSLQYTPEYTFNYTAISRETSVQQRRDKIKTAVQWEGNYWYHAAQKMAMRAFAKTQEFKYMYSERNVINSSVEGETYLTGGIRWNIVNNGGNYYPMSNELTRSSLNDYLYDFAMKTAGSNRRIMALAGKRAIHNFNENITEDFIREGGSSNTFGGMEVKGLAVKKYSIGTVDLDLVHYPLFDDDELFSEISSITGHPKNSSSILLLDMSPVEAVDGSGTIPPVQKYYFGDEYIHKYINGMTTFVGAQDAEVTQSDVDGAEFQILCDDGLYVIPERCGLIELTA